MYDKNQHHLIWSNAYLNLEDWSDCLEDWKPEVTDEAEQWELVEMWNREYLDDERANLHIDLGMPIIVIGDLGFWDGRRPGYKIIGSGNIADCLYDDCDYCTWYVDKIGDLNCDASHHDGNNHYLYRVFRDGTTPEQMRNLEDKICRGIATRRDITRVTRKIGPEIKKIYGWR